MSLLRSEGIDAAYLRIIDETVSAASCFQSPAVLEQLKQRWIEKLKARLNKTTTNNSHLDPPPAIRASLESFNEKCSLEGQSELNLLPNQEASVLPVTPSHEATMQQAMAQPHKASYESHLSTKKKESLLIPYNSITDQKNDTYQQSNTLVTHPTSTDQLNGQGKKEEEEEEEKEWNSAEWESVERPISHRVTPTFGEKITQDNVPRSESVASPPESKVQFGVKPTHPHLMRAPQSERSIIVESEQDLYDDLDEIDENSLSDLEDHDPEYSDIVVAQFESVQRPHARKPCHRGQWKLKLRRGILQIDGRELLFNTMTGDLSF